MGASTTLAILILLGSSPKAASFLFGHGHGGCGCPPPPPPPKCDCACAQQAAPQYAQQPQYAPQSAYYAPVQQQVQQQVAYAPAPAVQIVRPASPSEAYDAAIDNAALDTLGGPVAGYQGPAAGYQGPARGSYATAQQNYPSTAALNGFPSAQQSNSYAQSAGVYGGQSGYAQSSSQAVYGQQQGYAQPTAAASNAAPYVLTYPQSQAQPQYVTTDSAALNAFSQSIAAAQPASYARPAAAVAGLPASTIQYAQVPAGVAVDQHLARQIANEAATYVSNNGGAYVQTKQNAYARQHNPSINEYARVGAIEAGGSAAREQYMTRPEPVATKVTYVNTNLQRDSRPVHVVEPTIIDLPTPPAPTRAQFSASDTEILAAEQSDPMILPSASQHDAPLPTAAQTAVVETVDTTSLVLPTNDIVTSHDIAEVSDSVNSLDQHEQQPEQGTVGVHISTMSAPEFEQALQRAELVEDQQPVAVQASVVEEPKHTIEGESEFQGSPLTEENLLEVSNDVNNNEAEQHTTDLEESETLPDVHLTEGISIRTRVHAAPTAKVPRRDSGLARH